MKDTDEQFKNRILKEIDSLTVDNFDKFYDILKQFFGRAYGIKYQFTLDELHAEMKKREKNEKVLAFMEKFLDEVQAVEFGGGKVNKDQLTMVKKIFKKMVELIEVELEESVSEKQTVESKVRRRIDAAITVILILGLITVLIVYFVKVNIEGVTTETKVVEPGEEVNGETEPPIGSDLAEETDESVPGPP